MSVIVSRWIHGPGYHWIITINCELVFLEWHAPNAVICDEAILVEFCRHLGTLVSPLDVLRIFLFSRSPCTGSVSDNYVVLWEALNKYLNTIQYQWSNSQLPLTQVPTNHSSPTHYMCGTALARVTRSQTTQAPFDRHKKSMLLSKPLYIASLQTPKIGACMAASLNKKSRFYTGLTRSQESNLEHWRCKREHHELQLMNPPHSDRTDVVHIN